MFKRTVFFLFLTTIATAGFSQEAKEVRRFKVESGKQGVVGPAGSMALSC